MDVVINKMIASDYTDISHDSLQVYAYTFDDKCVLATLKRRYNYFDDKPVRVWGALVGGSWVYVVQDNSSEHSFQVVNDIVFE